MHASLTNKIKLYIYVKKMKAHIQKETTREIRSIF